MTHAFLNQVPPNFHTGHSAHCAGGRGALNRYSASVLEFFAGKMWRELRLRRTRRYQAELFRTLSSLGVETTMLRVNEGHPDGACIQDSVLFLQVAGTDMWVLILLQPGDPQRYEEVRGLAAALIDLVPQAYKICGEARIEGGDILVPIKTTRPIPYRRKPSDVALSWGRLPIPLRPLLLCGSRQDSEYDALRPYTKRTNASGLSQMEYYAQGSGYRFVEVPFYGSLHLTTVCSFIGRRDDVPYVFADPRHVREDAVAALDEVNVRVLYLPERLFASAWGVNVAYINGRRIVADYPGIPEFLASSGFPPDAVVPRCPDLEQLDTSLTCLLQLRQVPQ